LWPFGLFYGYLVYFSRFGMLHQDKSGNPDHRSEHPGNVDLCKIHEPISSMLISPRFFGEWKGALPRGERLMRLSLSLSKSHSQKRNCTTTLISVKKSFYFWFLAFS
jgi:hypothetical protein